MTLTTPTPTSKKYKIKSAKISGKNQRKSASTLFLADHRRSKAQINADHRESISANQRENLRTSARTPFFFSQITADLNRRSAQICDLNLRESARTQHREPKNFCNLDTMHENDLSYQIRGCIFKVYNNIGPGLLESAYENALAYELEKAGFTVQKQLGLPFVYEELKMNIGYRIDILVENKIIIEIKSVEALADVHYKQLLTYLKLSGKKLGLLVNFNTDKIDQNIKRIVNNLEE